MTVQTKRNEPGARPGRLRNNGLSLILLGNLLCVRFCSSAMFGKLEVAGDVGVPKVQTMRAKEIGTWMTSQPWRSCAGVMAGHQAVVFVAIQSDALALRAIAVGDIAAEHEKDFIGRTRISARAALRARTVAEEDQAVRREKSTMIWARVSTGGRPRGDDVR